jgi:hypothetical protein
LTRSRLPLGRAGRRAAAALLLVVASGACAARGHIATPAEIATLRDVSGLSAGGKIELSGPQGRVRARLVFGVARPDSLRIEIPAGAGLRFLLIARDGRLRADLPLDEAMYEGPATAAVMEQLFGIDVSPADLVSAILGSPPDSLRTSWRFDASQPAQLVVERPAGGRLILSFEDPETVAPGPGAFDFGGARAHAWTLAEMSGRLGLKK